MAGNCGECTRRWFCNENPETCGAFPELPPPTNADRIRGMADEELARFLQTVKCRGAAAEACDEFWEDDSYEIDWLQQPVKEEV